MSQFELGYAKPLPNGGTTHSPCKRIYDTEQAEGEGSAPLSLWECLDQGHGGQVRTLLLSYLNKTAPFTQERNKKPFEFEAHPLQQGKEAQRATSC